MSGAILLRPWWLLTVPVLALAALLLWRTRGLPPGWGKVIDGAMLAALAELGHLRRDGTPVMRLLPVTVAMALALALSGPALRRADAPTLRNLDAMLLVMDLSPSMVEGGSLSDAQAAAVQLLQEVSGRPVGLILYAGEPFLVAAPTEDPATVESAVAVLGPDTMPVAGSRPESALALSREVLDQAGIRSGDVVLISDGGGVGAAAIAEARRIRDSGARLSTVAVLPAEGPPDLPAGDPGALAQLADAGGGLATDNRGIPALSSRLARDASRALVDGDLGTLIFRDLGRWLLLLAMIPAALLFARRA